MNYTYKYIATHLVAVAALSAAAQGVAISPAQCVEMAIAHSETVKKAENSLSKADLDRKIASSAYLPRLEGSAIGLATNDLDLGQGSTLRLRGAYVAGLQLTQPIYVGGKIMTGQKLAKIGRDAAEQQLRMTRADVECEAAEAYWTLVAVRSKMTLMRQYMAMMDTLTAQTSVAVEAGLATDAELLRVNAKRSEIVYQQQKVTSGENLCRMALCNLLGLDADTPIELTDTLPECRLPDELSPDLANRPEMQLLNLQVKASEQQVKMTRADYLPTLALSVGYNYYGNIEMNGVADLGGGMLFPYTQKINGDRTMAMLSLKLPIWNWGEGYRKVAKARLDVENSRLDLTRNSRLMDLQATQASTNLIDGMEMVRSSEVALSEATESLRVMRNRYDEHMAPLTDLLQSQSQWHQALANHIEATTQFQINLSAWRRASGRQL